MSKKTTATTPIIIAIPLKKPTGLLNTFENKPNTARPTEQKHNVASSPIFQESHLPIEHNEQFL